MFYHSQGHGQAYAETPLLANLAGKADGGGEVRSALDLMFYHSQEHGEAHAKTLLVANAVGIAGGNSCRKVRSALVRMVYHS